MQPFVVTAVKAARRAGSLITRNMDQLHRIRVEAKARADFVTQIDRDAETDIVDTILRAYPDHGIIAEEGSEKPGEEYEWIIDPLDGTTNFLQGIPHFCVSIACKRRGLLEHAVILDPVRNELFTATRGEGAHLNERRIRVSDRTRFDRAVCGTGLQFKSAARIDAQLGIVRDMTHKTSGIRRSGSAALDLAYVAAGRLDAFWELDLFAWDMAAGALLVQEAGGLVCDVDGNSTHLESGDVVATNAKLHDQIMPMMKPLIRKS